MIGKVIEGRYAGASVNKLSGKNVLCIQSEDGTEVDLSKNNVISIDDVTDQYPSYGEKIMMILWNDFETSIVMFTPIHSRQDTYTELSIFPTTVKKETKSKRSFKTTKKLWFLTATVLAVTLATILLPHFFVMLHGQISGHSNPSNENYATATPETQEDHQNSYKTSLQDEYQKAEVLLAQRKYEDAATAFESLGNYADSNEKLLECKYLQAEDLLVLRDYKAAAEIYKALGTYSDSKEKLDLCYVGIDYQRAQSYQESKQYYDAAVLFYSLQDFEDSKARSFTCWRILEAANPICSGGRHTVALKPDGTVIAVGMNEDGQCNVSGWKDMVAISAGGYHTVGLKADGTVMAVGYNSFGQSNVSDWTNIIAISAGREHTVGLRSDGTVVAVGKNDNGRCNVTGWTDIVAVSAGLYHTVGLRANGTVVAVGMDGRGQCDVDDWTDIVAIGVGETFTIGLKSDGTVITAGWNGSGQCNVNDWTDIVAISVGDQHTVGLKADGTVVAVGHNGNGQCNVADWTDIVAISAGAKHGAGFATGHTIGLKSDGTVLAVGDNSNGQCNVTDWHDLFLTESMIGHKNGNEIFPGNREISAETLSLLYDDTGNLRKANEFIEVYDTIVSAAYQRYFDQTLSICKVPGSQLSNNYGVYINGESLGTTLGFSYCGNDTPLDNSFDQITILAYNGSEKDTASTIFCITTLMSMSTPSIGAVIDSADIINGMINEFARTGTPAKYSIDGVNYELALTSLSGNTMMSFTMNISNLQ